jgi:hypothetical protein
MSLADVIRTDLRAIQADLETPVFSWQGEDFACVASATKKALDLMQGGFSKQEEVVLVVDKSLFTDGIYPSEQQLITYKSKNYRIENVTQDPTGASLKLNCVSDRRGL